jgi:hypothetical protein
MRMPLIVVGLVLALLLLALSAAARAISASSWRWSIASAYSSADSPGTQGCTGRRLRDDTRTFANLIVPCGARVRFCTSRGCVTATRTDSGPYVTGRSFDLALGTVRALGFHTPAAFGVRTIRAFGILLSGEHKTQSRAYASEQITGRELLEQVAPEELIEVERGHASAAAR